MSKLRTALVWLLVGILFAVWSVPTVGLAASSSDEPLVSIQAGTGTVKFTFLNKTGATIDRLVLSGAKAYTFYNVPQGKSIYQIVRGKYKLEYKACGATKKKALTVQSNTKVQSVSCPVAKISVANNTGGNLIMSLTGPAKYQFVIPPGKTNIQVLVGKYKYYVNSPCGVDAGEVVVKKGRYRWEWFCR
jgi:hypothetical protein